MTVQGILKKHGWVATSDQEALLPPYPVAHQVAYVLPAPAELPVFATSQAASLAADIDAAAIDGAHFANSGEFLKALAAFREAAALVQTAIAAEREVSK